MSYTSQGPGWWLASDGLWYPPADPSGAVLAPPNPAFANLRASGYQGGRLRPTNALAIASLILSILWFIGIGSLLAVIFALVALSQINASNGAQDGRDLARAGLIIGIFGLIGAVGFFLILDGTLSSVHRVGDRSPASSAPHVTIPTTAQPPASPNRPITTLPAATNPQSAVNPLGVTLDVTNPSGKDFAKVLVLDVAYPVSVGVGSAAIVSVGVCAGPRGSRTAPSSFGFLLGLSDGKEVHAGPDSIPSLGPSACTDAELYIEIPPRTTPTFVGYHQYRWLVPAR